MMTLAEWNRFYEQLEKKADDLLNDAHEIDPINGKAWMSVAYITDDLVVFSIDGDRHFSIPIEACLDEEAAYQWLAKRERAVDERKRAAALKKQELEQRLLKDRTLTEAEYAEWSEYKRRQGRIPS